MPATSASGAPDPPPTPSADASGAAHEAGEPTAAPVIWLRFEVSPAEVGSRLGQALRGRGLSRGLLRRIKCRGAFVVNGVAVRLDCVLRANDRVEVYGRQCSRVAPEDLPLDIVFEDEHLLVVNKPPGMLVHPAGPELTGTLANAVAGRFRPSGIPDAPRPVNRLDRGTSGLVLFAGSPVVARALTVLRSRGEMQREYLAVTEGIPPARGLIDLPVGGKAALTEYRVCRRWRNAAESGMCGSPQARESECRWPDAAGLVVRPHTGRLHQVRVHLSNLGFPLIGDPLYGGRSDWPIGHPALHAWRLSFPHPVTGRTVSLCAPVPADFLRLIRLLSAR